MKYIVAITKNMYKLKLDEMDRGIRNLETQILTYRNKKMKSWGALGQQNNLPWC
jgi:hypothetical protein